MSNKNIFKSIAGFLSPRTDTLNNEGSPAFAMTPKQSLAQFAATGCFNRTFYTNAEDQLSAVLSLTAEVDAETIAKVAVFAREKGHMKDMPALLVAVLSVRDKGLFERIFPRVIDNGKMLRNFVQIMRSGVVGRKSLGSLPKRMVREWFEAREPEKVFRQSIGQSPSIADILKMVHPRPVDPEREALYGYFIGRDVDRDKLPDIVKRFERYKSGVSNEVPDVPFQMLTALPLGAKEWTTIARNAPWQMTRMNLNTFQRHGVFANEEMVDVIAARLRNSEAIKRSKVFPFQLMSAYYAADANMAIPRQITEALQDAMEVATENVPAIDGKVYVFPDVSGSMSSPVTGYRRGSTTAVRCIDVAGLFASAILRKNPTAEVMPFENRVVNVSLNPRDSVMTNAARLAAVGGGGTNCSAPLYELNRRGAKGDLVIYISDNESWVDADRGWNRGTETMRQWNEFRSRNSTAKLVCIDIQPAAHTQAKERNDILNVGGFSDQVFTLIAEFAAGKMSSGHWTDVFDKIEL